MRVPIKVRRANITGQLLGSLRIILATGQEGRRAERTGQGDRRIEVVGLDRGEEGDQMGSRVLAGGL